MSAEARERERRADVMKRASKKDTKLKATLLDKLYTPKKLIIVIKSERPDDDSALECVAFASRPKCTPCRHGFTARQRGVPAAASESFYVKETESALHTSTRSKREPRTPPCIPAAAPQAMATVLIRRVLPRPSRRPPTQRL